MKLKTTLKTTIIAMLFSFSANAQTYVYNETTSSGMFFQGTNGAQVANPVSDAVNSTANVARSATDGNWQQIQYFPTYAPVSGNKMFFSVYNPNNVGPGQIQFEYTSGGGWRFGGNVTYVSGSTTGWVEYSIDLSSHVGNTINKIIFMPAGGNSAAVFIDTIYFNNTSVIGTPPSTTTWVYNETTSSGMFFQGTNGAQVANPVPNSVNSSANVARSATDGNWQQIQYFPTYAPASGNKMFFSVYNPNNVGPGQIQFEYTSGGGWRFGGNVTYVSGSTTGWVEYSIDLSSHIGNTINKIIFMPAGGNSAAVFIDNIYFASQTFLSIDQPNVMEMTMFFDNEGYINFSKNLPDSELYLYDLSGRLIFQENINGDRSINKLNTKGIYILKVVSEGKTSTKKLLFN